jgi:hypothetical protein
VNEDTQSDCECFASPPNPASDAFSRYLPADQTSTPLQKPKINDLRENQTSTGGEYVEVSNEPKSLKIKVCRGVEVSKGVTARRSGLNLAFKVIEGGRGIESYTVGGICEGII